MNIINLIIIGNSGHKKVVEDVANSLGYITVGIIDDQYSSYYQNNGIYYGNSHYIKTMISDTGAKVFFGIGNNLIRKKIIREHGLKNSDFASLISPYTHVSNSSKIGTGTLVMPNAVINADTVIGEHSIINTSCVIEHDCIVEDFCHISPGAILTGGVKIREGSHIGAGAVVNPLVEVNEWSIIGSGSTVISNIESHVTAVGSPAKVIKNHKE